MFDIEMCFEIWILHSCDFAVSPFQGLLVEAVSFKQSFIEKHMAAIEFDAKVFL